MKTIVIVNFDVLHEKCKADVIAAFLKQLNDLRVTIVIQIKKDNTKLITFCGMYLHNPDFFASENVLVYQNSSGLLEATKAWAKKYLDALWAKSNVRPKQVFIIDKTADMSGVFAGVNTDVIKINGSNVYLVRIQEVISQLKLNIEAERKKKLAELDGKITREKAKFFANHELKMMAKKRVDCGMELAILDAIGEVLKGAPKEENTAHAAASSSADVMAPYEALWNKIIKEDLEAYFLKERIDKATSHGTVWMNGEKLEWVAKDDNAVLEKYKEWLITTLRKEVAGYREAFINYIKQGLTRQEMIELFKKRWEKKGHDLGEYEDAFGQASEEYLREPTTLEAEQKKEKCRALNESMTCIDVVGFNPTELPPTSSEDINSRDIYKVASGSYINRRKSILPGSALYDDNNQDKILADLKEKIAEEGDHFNVDTIDPRKQRALLHMACNRGLYKVVDFLIKEKKANVNLYDSQSFIFPPIFYAIEFVRQHPFQPKVLELLLEAGVTVNGTRNADGLTALSFAATVGEGDNNAFLVEIFLKWAIQKLANNIDLFVTNSNGRTALLEAASAGKNNVVKTFFKYGLIFTRNDVEKLDSVVHKTALTIYKDYLVDCMKQFGISPSDSPTKAMAVTSPRKMTCEWAPILHPCFAQLSGLVAKYNVKTGSPNGKSGSDIGDSRLARSSSLTQMIKSSLFKSNSLPKEIQIPTSTATSPATVDRVEPISEDINALDTQGYAPIHVACVTGHVGLFDELCKRGANLQAISREGCSPLYYAVMHGHASLVDKLLDKLAENKIALGVMSDEKSYLHYAVESGDPQTVRNIIQKAKTTHQTAYIFQRNKRGNTALMEAILSANKELIEAFLQNGIWLTDIDLRNVTILIEEQPNKRDIKNALKQAITKQLELLAEKLIVQPAAAPNPK